MLFTVALLTLLYLLTVRLPNAASPMPLPSLPHFFMTSFFSMYINVNNFVAAPPTFPSWSLPKTSSMWLNVAHSMTVPCSPAPRCLLA